MDKSVNLLSVGGRQIDVRRELGFRKPFTYLTREEVERFFAAIPTGNMRDRLLFDLLYRHGLRRSEVVALRLENLTTDNLLWVARAKNGVSAAYPLHPRSVHLLKRYLQERPFDGCRYLFRGLRRAPEPLSTSLVYVLFRRYAAAAQLPADKRHPHVFRHSIAVHLMNAGWDIADVKDWLGHVSIKNTEIYAQVSNERRSQRFRSTIRSRRIART